MLGNKELGSGGCPCKGTQASGSFSQLGQLHRPRESWSRGVSSTAVTELDNTRAEEDQKKQNSFGLDLHLSHKRVWET